MQNEDMLARLMAQAESDGADLITLRAIVEEATDNGAVRVIDRLGLGDATAHGDLDELRELLQAWRTAKSSAWKEVVTWTVRAVLTLLLIGIAVRLGLSDMIR
ncbi:MAG: hypothetical protein Pars2KO_24540 [Parasphingorhabdus sp.]